MDVRVNSDEERRSNPLLQALRHGGGVLHNVVLSAGAFDAVLCPTSAVLKQTGLEAVLRYHLPPNHTTAQSVAASSSSLDHGGPAPPSSGGVSPSQLHVQHPAAWFLLSHLIRFDNRGLSADFSTLSGHRGAFGDALDSVFVAGVQGRCHVLAHLDPLPAQSQEAHSRFESTTLNIFLIDGIMVDEDVVKRCKHTMALQQKAQPPQAAPAVVSSHDGQVSSGSTNDSSSAFTRLIGSVAGSWMSAGSSSPAAECTAKDPSSSSASTGKRSTTKKSSNQELAIQYPEFQRLMLLPVSSHTAKALHTFVDRIVVEAPAEEGSNRQQSSSKGKGSTSIDELAKEIRLFVQQMMSQLRRIPQWKGYETVAREGMEKYICSKLYGKLFSATWSEKQKDATLKRKITLLSAVVGLENLDGLVGVETQPGWDEAVRALREMNEFRSPRDKMDCVMRCCNEVQQCVARVTKEKRAQKEEKLALSTTPPNTAATAVHQDAEEHHHHASSTFGADDILPVLMFCVMCANPDNLHSNLVFIDRFRDKELMEPHGEYNLTCVQSCAEFWLTCQAHHLHITEDDFDTALGNVFAKPASKTHRAVVATDKTNGADDAGKSDGERAVDALFNDAPSVHVHAFVSTAVQTDDAVASATVVTVQRSPETVEEPRMGLGDADSDDALTSSVQHGEEEKLGSLTISASAARTLRQLALCSVSHAGVSTSTSSEFDDLSIKDLRFAWDELQSLRALREHVARLVNGGATQ